MSIRLPCNCVSGFAPDTLRSFGVRGSGVCSSVNCTCALYSVFLGRPRTVLPPPPMEHLGLWEQRPEALRLSAGPGPTLNPEPYRHWCAGGAVPRRLLSQPFLGRLHRLLAPHGVAAVNFYGDPAGAPARALAAELHAEFGHVRSVRSSHRRLRPPPPPPPAGGACTSGLEGRCKVGRLWHVLSGFAPCVEVEEVGAALLL